MQSLLTVSFNQSHPTLVEGGDQLSFLKKMEHKQKIPEEDPDTLTIFDDTKIEFKKSWADIDNMKFDMNLTKYHSITINMDPSKIGYSNKIRDQKHKISRIIWEYRNHIKFLSAVYEFGRGKLHWHLLINIQSVKKFKETLQEVFGKGRAVECKKVQPNHSETLQENLVRIMTYYKKEEHNKNHCYMFKSKK